MGAVPTDIELVTASATTYGGGSPFFQPAGFTDRLFRSLCPSTPGLTIFAVEGTASPAGWLGDFLALGADAQETANHPSLGFVHADFYVAAQRLLGPIAEAAKAGPIALAGHSRGAALVAMLAGLLIDAGQIPVKVGLFAPPRVGGQHLVDVISSVPVAAYRFGNDPVTDVPLTLPDFPYAQVPLIEIGVPCVIPTLCHHIENYLAGVVAYQATLTASP
jgi:lipase (class 3)